MLCSVCTHFVFSTVTVTFEQGMLHVSQTKETPHNAEGTLEIFVVLKIQETGEVALLLLSVSHLFCLFSHERKAKM